MSSSSDTTDQQLKLIMIQEETDTKRNRHKEKEKEKTILMDSIQPLKSLPNAESSSSVIPAGAWFQIIGMEGKEEKKEKAEGRNLIRSAEIPGSF